MVRRIPMRLAPIGGVAIALVLALAGGAAAQPPTTPLPVAKPAWSKTLRMPDGSTWVSDGALAVDAKVARPATLPTVVIPPASAKITANRLTAAYDQEIGLNDVRPASRQNTFATPDGIALNGNYITFLRSVLSPDKTRLRTKGKRDAVVVVTDGQAVALFMPLAPAAP